VTAESAPARDMITKVVVSEKKEVARRRIDFGVGEYCQRLE
jgi:hypothetical protein